MINRLLLKNFQKHKLLDLEFDPGVNVIVGPSDCGKSSIIRALYWLTFGKPSGESFVREGSTKCSVTVELAEGCSITRMREGQNRYIVNDLELKAFGTSVPEEVSRVLNLEQINFLRQMDPPFLISDSPGEVARKLNQIARLDIIDVAHTNIAGKLRRVQSDIRHYDAVVKTAETELGKFVDLELMEGLVAKAEAAEEKLKETTKARNTLLVVAASVVKARKRLISLPDTAAAMKLYEEAEKASQARKKTFSAIKALSSLLRDTARQEQAVKQRQEEAERLREEFEKIAPEECPLCRQPWKKTKTL